MRGNLKVSAVENLYDILMIDRKASLEQIEESFNKKAKFYDPDITGDNSNQQVFEQLKMAYLTLINAEERKKYDLYLDSVGVNMDKGKEPEIDPEEVERRRQERGK